VLGARLARRVLDELATMVRHTTEGQATELGWRRDNVVGLRASDYLMLTAKKTSWYTTVAPLRLGALVGSRGAAPLRALTRFGFLLGLAFQIRDDLLNLDGGNGQHGKELAGDLREGKRTLMLVHLLGAARAPDRAWLQGYLASPDAGRSEADAARLMELMRSYGSLALAAEYGHGIAQSAHDAFDEAFAGVEPSEHLDFIRGLVAYMVARPL
jgi:geranylgeranyl diphosphate synthase type II